MGVGKPDFRKGKLKNRTETGKIAQSPRGLRGTFPNLSLKHTGTLHATFVSSNNPPFSLKIEQNTLINYALQQISICSLNAAPFPRQKFGQSLKFLLYPYLEIIKVWLAKISFLYHSLGKYYTIKILGVFFDPPPPPQWCQKG